MAQTELLNIFTKEEDRRGTDILAMSDFFRVFIGKIEDEMDSTKAWKVINNVDGFIGEIAAAIKNFLNLSKIGVLVADSSHFSKDIIAGLKDGRYHIGQSKEVAGNLRPAIVDKDEHLVKFFTLKKAIDPTEILSNISTLSMQASLRNISLQIEDLDFDVKTMIDFSRREALSNKFIFARDKVMMAAMATEEEQVLYLNEADTYLMEGLVNLYSDMDAQVKILAKKDGIFTSVKSIDSILTYINEDMQMIPRYVGLRVYLLNYCCKFEAANNILEDYRYNLNKWINEKVEKSKYTAFQLVHRNYPYNKENVDFWIEKPKQMLELIDSHQLLLGQEGKDVIYIDAEDS